MRELSNVTRQDPSKRQTEVREFVRTVLSNPEALAHLTTWGIGLTDEPLPVPARILPAEKLNCGRKWVLFVDVCIRIRFRNWTSHVIVLTNINLWNLFYITKLVAFVFLASWRLSILKGTGLALPPLKWFWQLSTFGIGSSSTRQTVKLMCRNFVRHWRKMLKKWG